MLMLILLSLQSWTATVNISVACHKVMLSHNATSSTCIDEVARSFSLPNNISLDECGIEPVSKIDRYKYILQVEYEFT